MLAHKSGTNVLFMRVVLIETDVIYKLHVNSVTFRV